MINRRIRRGEMYWVNESHERACGSEQDGYRPAIVVSNDAANRYGTTCEVVFLTAAKKKDIPTHVNIKSSPRRSIALCEQITTISKSRIGNYIGSISPMETKAINEAMLVSLGFLDGSIQNEKDEY